MIQGADVRADVRADDPARDRADVYERILTADGRPGLYESNYLRAADPDGSGALWLKHNVLTAPMIPPVVEIWAVIWLTRDGFVPRVEKAVLPLEETDLATDRVALDCAVARLEPGRVTGSVGGVAWDLDVTDHLPPLRHFARDWMYAGGFPRKKVVTGSPRAVLDGSLTVDGQRVPVAGWVGHRNHNWGTEHALRYAYGGCNLWPGGERLTVEGFTAKIRLAGPLVSPWVTMVTGSDGGRTLGTGTLTGAARSAGRVAWPRWAATAPTAGRDRIRLGMQLDPAHAAGLRYLHPDGAVSYCYNVKDARTVLDLDGRRLTSGWGELEFLFPEPVPGIRLHGESSLPALRAAAGR